MKAYTVAIPNLPLFPGRKVKEFVKYIGTLEGFLGFSPQYPHGTLLLFRTENQAKRGRNLIENYPEYTSGVGKNICECEIDDIYGKEKE